MTDRAVETNNEKALSKTLIDLTLAVIYTPLSNHGIEPKAVVFLQDEIERHSKIRLPEAEQWPADRPVIVLGAANHPAVGWGRCPVEVRTPSRQSPEGFRLCARANGKSPLVSIIGNDARGLLYGLGCLLRKLHFQRGGIALPGELDVESAPFLPIRGHQLGYRDLNNTYDGWDLPQWEQYIRDLIVFGANEIELIPPGPDDQFDSVHFPRSRGEILRGVSRIAASYDLNVGLWWPHSNEDSAVTANMESALSEWGELFAGLPRLDDVFVPGGDPGNIPPRRLLRAMQKQSQVLRRWHPKAKMWVSPQGFSDAWMAEFLEVLKTQSPEWLNGVVYGPWVNIPIAEFRGLIPERYALRNYPDITHNFDCQYPVADWDIAFALTEGREAINPRPLAQRAIFHYALPHTSGFVAYSDGCHDDVNKVIWSALGWDPDIPVLDVLRDYARYFIGEAYAESFSQAILALEQNWSGALAANPGVLPALRQLQELEDAANPWVLKNWRFLLALYRAYYDAIVQARLLYETGLEEQALSALRAASRTGSLPAMDEAEEILDRAVRQPINQPWRIRLFQLAEALFQSIHLQLSVKLYRAQEEVRGASLDGLDFPLNNRPWLKARFEQIRAQQTEAERNDSLRAIVEWNNPGPGGFYDDFGTSRGSTRIVGGGGYENDPNFLHSPMKRYPYRKDTRPVRLAWRGSCGTMQDTPLAVHYAGLDPRAQYRLRVTYSSQAAQVKISLHTREGVEIHPLIAKPDPPQPLEFALPAAALGQDELNLVWRREPGAGGTGTGCEICEVWLIRSESTA